MAQETKKKQDAHRLILDKIKHLHDLFGYVRSFNEMKMLLDILGDMKISEEHFSCIVDSLQRFEKEMDIRGEVKAKVKELIAEFKK